jgi:hypothetical protein
MNWRLYSLLWAGWSRRWVDNGVGALYGQGGAGGELRMQPEPVVGRVEPEVGKKKWRL